MRVGLLLRRIATTRAYGDGNARGSLDRCCTSEHDEIGERGVRLQLLQLKDDRLDDLRVVDLPVLLRRDSEPCAIGTASVVAMAVRVSGGPSGKNEVVRRNVQSQDLLLQRLDRGLIQRRPPGDRILSHQHLLSEPTIG